MNYTELWDKEFASICSIRHRKNGEEVSVGSGFVVDGYLITNNHVFCFADSDEVEIRFVDSDSVSTTFSKIFKKSTFTSLLKDGSDEKNWDFAILEVEDIKNRPSLKFCKTEKVLPIGMQVAMFGYQFSVTHLSMHVGIISSKFFKGSIPYIQIDGSINVGNSGGPLIDVETGEVVGIVTRAAKGLTENFDKLIESFDGNISVMNAVQGMVKLGGVDIMQALLTTQNQMKIISKEMKRSANVGIGYAFDLTQVRKFFSK